MNGNDLTRPVLIAGVSFGVLTAVPPLGVLNLCTCCSLFAATGFLATYILKRDSSQPLSPGRGAQVGLAAGALGAFVHTAFSIPIAVLMRSLRPVDEDVLGRILDAIGDDGSPLAVLLRELMTDSVAPFSVIAIVVQLVVMLVLFGVFSMLGGILGVALLEKRQPQPAYAPPPPPAAPPQDPGPPELPEGPTDAGASGSER